MSRIALEKVAKAFGPVRVLDGLDLEVADGTVLAVLGPSGSGKTTLLRIVAGFERPDAGTVTVGGAVVDGDGRFVPPERRRIGFVPQEGALFPHLTVARNVGFGLRRSERPGRVDELLELVGMAGLGHRYPHELSGGQQQRVALARALAPRPSVVLLDEPFSALDATMRASIRAEVVRILRDAAVTALLVTHDQEEALSVADLVGVMAAGRLAQVATPDELYRHPVDLETARFLGEANLVAGEAGAGGVRTRFGELRLTGPAAGLAGPVTVLVRPEQFRLVAEGGVAARVVAREYYGHDSVVQVDAGEASPLLRIRCAGHLAAEPGEQVLVAASGETVAWADAPPA